MRIQFNGGGMQNEGGWNVSGKPVRADRNYESTGHDGCRECENVEFVCCVDSIALG